MSPDEPYDMDYEYLMSYQPDEQEALRERGYQIMEMANLVRFEKALKQIVNVLGPEELVDGCPDCMAGCPGLLAEVNEALNIAKQALRGKHAMPPEENT